MDVRSIARSRVLSRPHLAVLEAKKLKSDSVRVTSSISQMRDLHVCWPNSRLRFIHLSLHTTPAARQS